VLRGTRDVANRFNGFRVAADPCPETVETVADSSPPKSTPLEQGVNESCSPRKNLRCALRTSKPGARALAGLLCLDGFVATPVTGDCATYNIYDFRSSGRVVGSAPPARTTGTIRTAKPCFAVPVGFCFSPLFPFAASAQTFTTLYSRDASAPSIVLTPRKPRICISCAEPMIEGNHAHLCNPNVCAACLSLLGEKQERGTCRGMPRRNSPLNTPRNLTTTHHYE